MSRVNTKDWVMGHYPSPPRPKLTVLSALADLMLFNHAAAARVLESALIRCGGIRCECAAMLQHKAEHCAIHPKARLKTREEMAQFARDWDAKVEAGRACQD